MSKELTPLEALEILKEANTIYCGCASNLFARYRFEIETIETALKDSEMEHTLRVRLENINYELVREKEANEKKLKALEIIKERQVDVGLLIACETEPEYLNRCCNRYWQNEKCGWKRLSQEEFDLLKEELE